MSGILDKRQGRLPFNIVDGLFIVLCIAILLATTLFDKYIDNPYPNSARYGMGGYMLIAFGLIYLSYKLHARFGKLSNRTFLIVAVAIGLVTAVLCVAVAMWMPVEMGSDFAHCREMAISLAEGGTFGNNSYFAQWPNNVNITILFAWVYGLFGSWRAVIIIGALSSMVSAVLVALTVNNIVKSCKWSAVAFIVSAVYLVLSFRTYIPYTDNYAMPYVALILFVYTSDLKAQVKLPLIVLAASIGAWIKITVLIILVAVAVHSTLVRLPTIEPKRAIRRLSHCWGGVLSSIVIVVAVFAFITPALYHQYDFHKSERSVSWQYYLMLGQDATAYGTVGGDKFKEAWHDIQKEYQTASERADACLSVALSWIADKGLYGNAVFGFKKLDVIFDDGEFHNAQHYDASTVGHSLIYEFFSNKGRYYSRLAGVMQVFWAFIILLITASLRYDSFNDDPNGSLFKIAMMGVVVYLLTFECRSKYLFMFLPVFFTYAICMWRRIENKVAPRTWVSLQSGRPAKVGLPSSPASGKQACEMAPLRAVSAERIAGSRAVLSSDTRPLIWLVVPCYNEEAVLARTAPLFLSKLVQLINSNRISSESKIVFVDDGSEDDTWVVISQYIEADERYAGIKLSRNRGHQNALMCGLMEARGKCDAAISVDCDGQDDIEAIDSMIAKFVSGNDIVYGVREDRSTDSVFKRGTAHLFYKLMRIMNPGTIYNHADYRLLSRRALNELAGFEEVNLFLRGMIPLIGLPHTVVYYKRNGRLAGESHYSFGKMMALALNGITSMSVRPLRFVSGIGFAFCLLGFFGVLWAIVSYAIGRAIAGWASIIVALCLLGGIQLFCLGILGEYVGRIYLESKKRPRFIIEERSGYEAL